MLQCWSLLVWPTPAWSARRCSSPWSTGRTTAESAARSAAILARPRGSLCQLIPTSLWGSVYHAVMSWLRGPIRVKQVLMEAGASFNENDLKQIFLVAWVSKTKEISTSKYPPPSPASNPNSYDQEPKQNIHENDEEDYQPFSSIQNSPSSKFVSDSNNLLRIWSFDWPLVGQLWGGTRFWLESVFWGRIDFEWR